MTDEEVPQIGFIPVVSGSDKFLDSDGTVRDEQRSEPDRRVNLKDAAAFEHLRNILRRESDRDLQEYLRTEHGVEERIEFKGGSSSRDVDEEFWGFGD